MKISGKDFNFIAFVIEVLYFNLGDSDDEPEIVLQWPQVRINLQNREVRDNM